jgi:hypothetical protein
MACSQVVDHLGARRQYAGVFGVDMVKRVHIALSDDRSAKEVIGLTHTGKD